jgi:hypothetical protein
MAVRRAHIRAWLSTMKYADHNEIARAAAMDFAHRLVPRCQEMLGADLLSAYVIGIVAHSGFSWRYSDVDMALVTTVGLSPSMLDRLRGEAMALSADWGAKVSVFWADRHFSCGRFPPLDRVDYLDHAIVLVERESVRRRDPSWRKFGVTCVGRPLRAGWNAHAASPPLRRLRGRITRPICERSFIPLAFATAG